MRNLEITCKESGTNVDEEKRDEIVWIMEVGEDEDYIQALLGRESARTGRIQWQEYGGDWILQARLNGIHYILEKREFLMLRFQTAYLSVAYLDGYLSRKPIDAGKKRTFNLLCMACLSLAAKMEEPTMPPLSELCSEGFNFESRFIWNMELLVLNTLDWRMALVTPFAFLHFFVKKLYGKCPINGFSRIMEVILFAVRDEKIMRHKASVICASATLVVVDNRFTRQALGLKISPLTSRGVLEIENFIACYDKIQELDLENPKSHQEIMSSWPSPRDVHKPEGKASPVANFLSGTKEFKESDQIDELPNMDQNQ